MPAPSRRIPGQLPRLEPTRYRGPALVLWTHTLRDRATGWLDSLFHARFRELLTHVCARYQLACPAYVLMPDHMHLTLLGLASDSDQRQATRLFRQHLGGLLAPHTLQPQPHDHVLREEDRARDAFPATCHYVLANPERAHLVARWQDWPHLGALVPGYPRLDPRDEDYHALFWRIHANINVP
jgi:putative transposase